MTYRVSDLIGELAKVRDRYGDLLVYVEVERHRLEPVNIVTAPVQINPSVKFAVIGSVPLPEAVNDYPADLDDEKGMRA